MSQQSTTSHGLPGAKRAGRRPGYIKAVILAAVSLGQFMIQMDLTVVNVALPAIGRHLHGPTSGLQWVIDGYSGHRCRHGLTRKFPHRTSEPRDEQSSLSRDRSDTGSCWVA